MESDEITGLEPTKYDRWRTMISDMARSMFGKDTEYTGYTVDTSMPPVRRPKEPPPAPQPTKPSMVVFGVDVIHKTNRVHLPSNPKEGDSHYIKSPDNSDILITSDLPIEGIKSNFIIPSHQTAVMTHTNGNWVIENYQDGDYVVFVRPEIIPEQQPLSERMGRLEYEDVGNLDDESEDLCYLDRIGL